MADVGRESEIRYLGEIDSSPAAVERIIGKLAGRYSMPIHTRPRLAGIGDDLSITRGGTDGLHDSPLEGGGFELPVPLPRAYLRSTNEVDMMMDRLGAVRTFSRGRLVHGWTDGSN